MNHRLGFVTGTSGAGPGNLRPLIAIESRDDNLLVSISEVWKYRELLYYLVWRDVKLRYKQTLLGFAWAILQPLMLMVVFIFFFSRLTGASSFKVPSSLFFFAGILPWSFFSGTVSSAGQSIVGAQNLVRKVYFPRLILPLSSVGIALVDLMAASLMLLPMMLYYRVFPGWGLWVFPVALLGLILAAFGTGALLTALTVTFRDLRYIVPFMLQLWMFTTPAIFMAGDALPLGSRWRPLLALNPAHGLIMAFRSSLLNMPVDYLSLGISLVVSLSLLTIGCTVFLRKERYFADNV